MRFNLQTTNLPTRKCIVVVVIVVALPLALAGCTRDRYYRRADKEATCLIYEKSNDPRWAIPSGFTVDMDPRSRFRDVCNPVYPPMPPDDPASNCYMQCVDGMKGFQWWHAHGDRQQLDNPEWRKWLGQYAELTAQGGVKLSLDSAVRLAYVNSPDFQSQLETLYLSALDVSTERFRFDTQFFGTNNTSFTHQGRLSADGETNTLETDTSFELDRRFATAGELVVGLANSIVWQFAGPDTFSNISILNFNLVQPLLRGAGRAVALEQLTIVERALLANLRWLQFYRQGFYEQIAIGDFQLSGLQRRGGLFGSTGLTNFTGAGTGGFGNLGGGGGISSGSFVGGGAANLGGYVGLLQFLQQIRNAEQNLNSKLRALGMLEAHLQAGTINLTQVDQFRQSIETQRAQLLQSHNAMENGLEYYKIYTLGLPPDLPMELDDNPIRQFQFLSPPVITLQNEFGNVLSEFGEQPAELEIEAIQPWFERLAGLRSRLEREAMEVDKDLQGLEQHSSEREATMTPAEAKLFVAEIGKLHENLADLHQRIARAEPQISQLREQLTPANRRQTADRLVQLVTEVSQMTDELSLIQARARVEAVTIKYETLSPAEALDIARANRLDWMNNRAALVDTWRLIQFNANLLRSGLNVTFSGDMSTVGNNPLQFRAPTGSLRVGLQFDAPFTRLLEQNNFRQSLITYEQQRRALIQYEDGVNQTLRQLLRNLDLDKVNLEIQRRAVVIAIRRVDETQEVINKPPPPLQPGQEASSQLGPTAALDLLNAISALTDSQNSLMSVWLDYYATRMRLARELGVMQLDACGLWIDQPLSAAERLRPEEVPLPPPLPDRWLEQIEPGPSSPQGQTEPPSQAPTQRDGQS